MLQRGEPAWVEAFVSTVATGVEVVGVLILVLAAAGATAAMIREAHRESFAHAYRSYRRNLGRGILLGLEFLVIADIIGTVAVHPTFYNLGVLGIIVLIRTFLSMSLEIEIEGRLPWREAARADRARHEL